MAENAHTADEKYVYVLRLEGGNYYVGVSVNPESRISDHLFNRSHHWTTEHSPTHVVKIYGPVENYLEMENHLTVTLGCLIGSKKVAGGEYTARGENNGFPKAVREFKSPGEAVCFGATEFTPIKDYLDLSDEVASSLAVC